MLHDYDHIRGLLKRPQVMRCERTCLFAKRLEKGRFTWPITKEGVVTLTPAQLSMLVEGIDWRMPQRTYTPQVAG